MEVIDHDRYVARITVCNGCDQLQLPDVVCAACNCPMRSKLLDRDATCPLGKWPAVDEIG